LLEEALELRAAGISKPVFCLGGFWPAQADELIELELTPVLFRLDAAAALNERARAHNRVVNVHVKVDTGMGRLGVPLAELAEFIEALKPLTHLRLVWFDDSSRQR
jgi:alanine racemase